VISLEITNVLNPLNLENTVVPFGNFKNEPFLYELLLTLLIRMSFQLRFLMIEDRGYFFII